MPGVNPRIKKLLFLKSKSKSFRNILLLSPERKKFSLFLQAFRSRNFCVLHLESENRACYFLKSIYSALDFIFREFVLNKRDLNIGLID